MVALIRSRKKSLGSHQRSRQIFKKKKKEPHSSSNTQSWETCEMHAFFLMIWYFRSPSSFFFFFLMRTKTFIFQFQIFSTRVQHTQKKWTQSDLSFCKNEGSKNFKLMEKGVNWIENEGIIDTKCLKSVK